MSTGSVYSRSVSPQGNPLGLAVMAVVVGGAVVGLNKVSVWFAPAVLVASLVGMEILIIRQRREARRERGRVGVVNHARLASTQVGHLLPWLRENVRGQGSVIDAVFSELERSLRLAKPGKTLGAYLLVGPTGTGKTFLAQLVGQALFPESEPVILRMNQYKHSDDVYTLIGPPPGMPGYEVGGALTRPVLENSYRVIVLDELEKCHPDVQHCLYDIVDTAGCREKSSGRFVDFSGCVFFATCNAGVEPLRKIWRQTPDPAVWQGRSRDALVDAAGFDRAFLARWNGIYLMDELAPLHVAEVACLQLAKYWREYGIEVAYTSPEIILDAVSRNEEFRAYGVRQLGAYVQTKTNPAIEEARQRGVKNVWLGVADDGSLTISEFQ